MKKITACLLITMAAIIGFVTSQLVEDFVGGFKMGLREHRSELFRQKYDGRPNAVFSKEGGIQNIHNKISINQADYVYKNGKLIPNENKAIGSEDAKLPSVQLKDFQSDYFRIIGSLDSVVELVKQTQQNLVNAVPADALRADDETEQQLDYLNNIILEIGTIYGWRIATGEMISMANLSESNRDNFDIYFREWLGYQVSIIDSSVSWHYGANEFYVLNDSIKEIRRQYISLLSELSLVLKRQFPSKAID